MPLNPDTAAHDIEALPEFSRAWAVGRLAQHEGVVGIAEMSAVGAWLASLPTQRPKMVGKLYKLTWAQAVLASTKWSADADRRRLELLGYGGAPDDFTPVLELGDGYRWVLVTSPQGLDFEGAAMGHCVGGGAYDTSVIYSLRDKDGMPHATLRYLPERSMISHVQGRPLGRQPGHGGPLEGHPGPMAFARPGLRMAQGIEVHRLIEVHNHPAQATTQPPIAVRYRPMVRSLVEMLGATMAHPRQIAMIAARLPGCRPALFDLDELAGTPNLTINTNLNLQGMDGVQGLSPNLVVNGSLNLKDCTSIRQLPPNLCVIGNLDIRGCTALEFLPTDLRVGGHIRATGCTALRALPQTLQYVQALDLDGCVALQSLGGLLRVDKQLNLEGCTALHSLGSQLDVGGSIDLSGCKALAMLPSSGRVVGQVNLRGCTGLTELSRWLDGAVLVDAEGCTALATLPAGLHVGNFSLKDCTALAILADGLTIDGHLKLKGCTALRSLGQGTRIKGWLSLIGAASIELPSDIEVGEFVCYSEQQADEYNVEQNRREREQGDGMKLSPLELSGDALTRMSPVLDACHSGHDARANPRMDGGPMPTMVQFARGVTRMAMMRAPTPEPEYRVVEANRTVPAPPMLDMLRERVRDRERMNSWLSAVQRGPVQPPEESSRVADNSVVNPPAPAGDQTQARATPQLRSYLDDRSSMPEALRRLGYD